MMTHRTLIFASLVSVTVMACDCHYHVSGIVVDKVTGMPVANATLGKTDTTDLDNPFNRKSRTNEKGEFDIHGVAGVCDEVTIFISKDDFVTKKVTFVNNAFETVYLVPKNVKREIFDINSPFEISELKKANDYPSSSKDTSICLNWNLDSEKIKKVMGNSQPIDGPGWHHLFEHLPCRMIGVVSQKNQNYGLSINGGSWFTISSSDTTLIYGSFNKENNKYFIKSAMTHGEIKD